MNSHPFSEASRPHSNTWLSSADAAVDSVGHASGVNADTSARAPGVIGADGGTLPVFSAPTDEKKTSGAADVVAVGAVVCGAVGGCRDGAVRGFGLGLLVMMTLLLLLLLLLLPRRRQVCVHIFCFIYLSADDSVFDIAYRYYILIQKDSRLENTD